MIEISIVKDFTTTPGARNYEDGPFSGQEFYEKLLKPKYIEAKLLKQKLKIVLDGTDGFPSSFLNEAFSKLGTEFGSEEVWSNLILVSDEVPKYLTKIKDSVYEKRK